MRRALLAIACAMDVAAAQDGPALQWTPARPRPGTLITVQLTPSAGDGAWSGALAGEPLHFEPHVGGWRAWAAVPVDSSGPLTLTVVRCVGASACDTTRRMIPVAPATYPIDRLRVAPRFGQSPDSATAARIRAEFAEARAVSRGAHDTPRLWGDGFRRPRAARITSGFGNARAFNGAITSRHTGTDFAGAVGAPVQAAARGVVRAIGAFYYAGRAIYIDHGAGFVTAYFHLSRVDVAVGDTVQRGQRVGAVGATGRVTGPHLHFVARYGEVSVDPLTLPGLAATSVRR